MVTWAIEAHCKVPPTDFFSSHARFRRERDTFVPSIWVLLYIYTPVKSGVTPQIHRAGRQSEGHQAGSHSMLGVGCRLAPAAKSCVSWVYVRMCAYRNFSLVFFCGIFVNRASITHRGEAQRIEVQYMISVSGCSITHLHSTFSSPCRALSHRTARGRALKPLCRCWTLDD